MNYYSFRSILVFIQKIVNYKNKAICVFLDFFDFLIFLDFVKGFGNLRRIGAKE